MQVHLVDGTYELFRHFYGVPSHRTAAGAEVAAARGVLQSVMRMLSDGATHVGVATDHVIESFRNELWAGYKTGEGIDPNLWSQFWPLEEALLAMGVVVWPMVELEADDAMASGAAVADEDPAVEQVLICTPDKDLGQCVRGNRVVQLDRRKGVILDQAAVMAKFGVPPTSIPDYLALVGDAADGLPGLPRLGGQDGRGRPRPLRPYRGHPGGPESLGAAGAERGNPFRHPARPLRRRPALQAPGHAPGRPVAAHIGRRAPVAGSDRRLPGRVRRPRCASAGVTGRSPGRLPQ